MPYMALVAFNLVVGGSMSSKAVITTAALGVLVVAYKYVVCEALLPHHEV